MKKLNSLLTLIILFILLKQISAQCYAPVDILKDNNQIKPAKCGEWVTKDDDDKANLVGDNESMFQVKFTCLLVNQDELCEKAHNAFNNAGKIISETLKLKEQITVNATFMDFCEGQSDLDCPIEVRKVIGAAGPIKLYSLLDDDGLERIYPQALVKQFQFQGHPKYDDYDILALFNARTPLYFANDTNKIGASQYDFDFVVTHELIHGLGFMSLWKGYPSNSSPTGLWPTFAVINSGPDGDVEPKPKSINEPVTVKESIFNKFMIRLDNGSFTSEYTRQIGKYFLDNKDVADINQIEFEQTYQFQLMKEMLRLSTTPKSVGFLPHSSTDAIILETSLTRFQVGSSLSHVDFSTYSYSSDFLMVFKGIPGKTYQEFIQIGGNYAGGMIGPKLKSILETIGYATEDYPNPYKPQPFKRKPGATKSNAIFNSISNFNQFCITIFIVIVTLL